MFLMNKGVIQIYGLECYPKDHLTSLILSLRGVFGFLQIATFVCALKLISLIEVVTIFNLCPIFVGVTGAIFLKEPFRPIEILSAFISLLGFLLIVRPEFLFSKIPSEDLPKDPSDASNRVLGLLLAVISPIFMTVVTLILRKVKSGVHAFVSMQYLAASTILFAPLGMIDRNIRFPTLNEGFYLFLIVSFSFLGEVTRTRGIQLEKAGRGSIFNYLIILFSFVWNVLFLKESVSLLSIAGTTLILTGAVLLFSKT